MSTRHGVAEPEVGQLVFQAVGTLAFDDLDDCAAFPAPKGYARHVACSSKYGVTCFADGGGVRVIETTALVAHAASTKEKMPREQLCPPDAFATIAIPDVSCVAFSPCETILAVCVGPQVRFLETRALVACAREPTATPTPEPFAMASLGADESSDRVRDFLWQPGGASGGLAYLALAGPEDSDEGKLFVGTAGADDGVDIADRVVAVAMAPPPDEDPDVSIPVAAWATAAGDVVYAKLKDRGLAAEMRGVAIGKIDDGDGEAEVDVEGLAFGPRPGLALIVAAREREDPDRHHVLVLDAGTPEVSNFWDVVSPPPAPSCTRLEGTFDIDDDETAGLRGPYLHGLTVRQWAWRSPRTERLGITSCARWRWPGSAAPAPRALQIDDDRCVPAIPLAGADEDSNFVTGLAADHGGRGSRMPHPADKSRPPLPQGPTVLVATADHRVTVMRVGHLDDALGGRYADEVRVSEARLDVVDVPSGAVLAAEAAGSAASSPAKAAASQATSAVPSPVKAADQAPKAGGFSAAFLAKANAGYDAAQKALQEDLDKAAGKASADEPAAPKAGAAGAFSFGAARVVVVGGGGGIVRLWRDGERSVVFVWSAPQLRRRRRPRRGSALAAGRRLHPPRARRVVFRLAELPCSEHHPRLRPPPRLRPRRLFGSTTTAASSTFSFGRSRG